MFCCAVAISCYTVSVVAQIDTVARRDYVAQNTSEECIICLCKHFSHNACRIMNHYDIILSRDVIGHVTIRVIRLPMGTFL